MSSIFDKTSQALGATLNMRQLRQNVISSNIANSETPGYKAKKMDFENSLASALQSSSEIGLLAKDADSLGDLPLQNVRADVYENPDAEVSNDGNTVNVEKEMVSLAENTVLYKAAVQLMNKKLAALKYATSEGGR